MKIFGKELFKQKAKVMYDFAQHGLIKGSAPTVWFGGLNEAYTTLTTTTSTVETPTVKVKKTPKKDTRVQVTPKGIYVMGSLNDNNFTIKIDKDYLDKEIKNLSKKLKLIYVQKNSTGGGSYYGKQEIESVIERLENRKQIKKVKDVIEKYPHTTSALINKVLEDHKHLRFALSSEFVPDLPQEAIDSMVEYNQMCQTLCGKDTVFYLIAEKEDFEQKNKRRDPILLAESPFGFFFQVLGAWDDKHIIFLEEL